MKQDKIAVIGGTGKSGTYLVQELMRRSIPVKLLLRTSSSFETDNPLIEIVRGDARDYEAIHKLLEGCIAVISTLGQPKGERSIFSDATGNILRAMKAHGINRYLVTTGLNVNAPGDAKNEQTRMATEWMYQNFPETTKDKQAEYELLAGSNADWTMVRLPRIIQTEEHFPVKVDLKDCPGEKISAADLACFLADQLSGEEYIRKSPFLANS
ncbi:NAD(P)H-binding protein [Fluviicola sp.]|uniref:NAD(P)-dependent oxidoreductase n=1 Tax=Fluviicola sp. TaxID=1917219 RepID=UPI0031D2AF8F